PASLPLRAPILRPAVSARPVAILIASRETAEAARRLLAAAGGPALAGVIWAGPAGAAGLPGLGSLAGLQQAAAGLGVTEAIICLPGSAGGAEGAGRSSGLRAALAAASEAGLTARLLPAPQDLLRPAPEVGGGGSVAL